MSARKVQTTGTLENLTVEARQTRLSLSPDSVVIHRNGIEFRSVSAFATWTEMTITLQSPRGDGKVHCTGVVISCTGNKHTGYHVSMVFTNVSRQAQSRLTRMSDSPLG